MKKPWTRRRRENAQSIDLTTEEARREYEELCRLEHQAGEPRRIVEFTSSPQQQPSPVRPRWRELPYDDPSRLGFLVVRERRR